MLPAPVEQIHDGFRIVRDDLLAGGTKMRAIMPLLIESQAAEFVYASPAQGYAQVALAHCAAAAGRMATVFTAKRKNPHALTRKARAAGAKVVLVQHGYLTVVQARAREYAREVGADLIPFGCEDIRCMRAIAEAAQSLAVPAEVWTVAGSGVLTRSLQMAWPLARFFAVVVGKKDCDTGRAARIICPLAFEAAARRLPPFPSAINYDAKAWQYVKARAAPGALFWNVGA